VKTKHQAINNLCGVEPMQKVELDYFTEQLEYALMVEMESQQPTGTCLIPYMDDFEGNHKGYMGGWG
jgi:hypothetical protein